MRRLIANNFFGGSMKNESTIYAIFEALGIFLYAIMVAPLITILFVLSGMLSGYIFGFIFTDTCKLLIEFLQIDIAPYQLGGILGFIWSFFNKLRKE